MSLQTLNEIFFTVVECQNPRVTLHRVTEEWIPTSSNEFYRNVVGVSRTLESWGIAKGDRVAIQSENRPEWTIADFACLLLGIVTVPVYPTLTGQQTAYILRDSGARAVFVSTKKQLEKLVAVKDQTAVERVVVMDTIDTNQACRMRPLMDAGPDRRDEQFNAHTRMVAADDLATIIYTSGTTGTPKGAMLTHGNLASNISYSFLGFNMRPGQVSLSFLPLSHVTARHVDFALLYHGVTLAYCPFVEQLPQSLLEVRPTIFVAVPRIYEKIHNQVALKTRGFPSGAIYHWALSVGHCHKAAILAGEKPSSLSWKLADKLVYSQVRGGMGGRAEIFISGGAPLGGELADWYATIGIRIHEGYGLTETSPVIAVNKPGAHKLGTVGKPLPNVEIRIAEDGEILVRGPSVFKGYWNQAEETRNAFLNGWFKTGDIGKIDSDGFLSITDRKKDLIKTSGGKFIAPQPIESMLKHNALIAEAAVLGDKRKFPAVLIAPYFPLLEDWAKVNHVSFSTRADLVAHPKVRALYQEIVEDVNQKLARFEKLKKVLIVADEFSVADGTLTPSLKVRRRAIDDRYKEEIDEMYARAEAEPVAYPE